MTTPGLFSLIFTVLVARSTAFKASNFSVPDVPAWQSASVNCTASSSEIDPSCWETLNVTGVLQEWSTDTPQCTGLDTSECCTPNEPWSDCFLRMVEASSGSSCYNIDSCLYDGTTLNDKLNRSQSDLAAYHYVVYNIYAINFFFSSWYHATDDAFSDASSTITSIIKNVDPIKQARVALSDVLSALSFGLVFLAGPGAAADATTKAVGELLTVLIQQSPGFAKAMWPVGTEDSQLYQISELDGLNENITHQLEATLNTGLQKVEGDLDSFIAFASGGAFSVPEDQRPSLPNQTDGLLLALTTYLVSTALKANGWNAAIVAGVDPRELTTNSSATLPAWALDDCTECHKETDMGCQSYDANNMCGRWWYSSDLNSAYTLWGSGAMADGNPDQIISTILSNNWATGASLFQNASLCDQSAAIVNGSVLGLGYSWLVSNGSPVSIQLIPAENFTAPTVPIRFRLEVLNVLQSPLFWQSLALSSLNDSDTTITQYVDPSYYLKYKFTFPNGGSSSEHPSNTLFNYTSTGIDFSCTSKLDLTVMTSWYDVIHGVF